MGNKKKKLIDLYYILDVNSMWLDLIRSLFNVVDYCCSKSNKNGILKVYQKSWLCKWLVFIFDMYILI